MPLNRRSLLLSLAAMGATLVRPLSWIQLASEAELTEACEAQAATPFMFEVDNFGTLYVAGFEEPRTRADCLGIHPGEVRSINEVMDLIDRRGGALEAVAKTYLSGRTPDKRDPWDVDLHEVTDWLEADPDHIASALEAIDAWLQDSNLGENDYETAELQGNTSQSAALLFWRDEIEIGDLLGIDIVEGDCPGSSYYAANLRVPLEDANALAKAHGLPILFTRES